MQIPILFPCLGRDMAKATISQWLKDDGDLVCIGQPLVELTTQKATVELSAEQSGIITILHQPGGVVAAGDTLGLIEVEQPPAEPIVGSIHARLVQARPLRRVIRLSGALEATVEYDGWGVGYESVSVNGNEVVRVKSSDRFGHRLGFELPTPAGNVQAWLEVFFDMLKLSVRLTVAGRVVWSEGAFGVVGGQRLSPELPIPTSPANEDAANLPGVADEPSGRNDIAG
ncbi:MAG: biotin/lipoyl-containing protein [Actinomycetota bacterium]